MGQKSAASLSAVLAVVVHNGRQISLGVDALDSAGPVLKVHSSSLRSPLMKTGVAMGPNLGKKKQGSIATFT